MPLPQGRHLGRPKSQTFSIGNVPRFRVLKKHDISRTLFCCINGKRCAQRTDLHRNTGREAVLKTSPSGERKARTAALRENLTDFVASPEFSYPDQDRHKFRECHKQVLVEMSRGSNSPSGSRPHSNPSHRSLRNLFGTRELYIAPGLLGGDSKHAQRFFVPRRITEPLTIESRNQEQEQNCDPFLQYRDPAWATLSWDEEDDDEAPSVPNLSDEIDEAFEPLPFPTNNLREIALLCQFTAGWSVQDKCGSETRPIASIHANVLPRHQDGEQTGEQIVEPTENFELDTNLNRELRNQSGLSSAAKPTCAAADSDSYMTDSEGASDDSIAAPMWPSQNHVDWRAQNAAAFRDDLRSFAAGGTVSAPPAAPVDKPGPSRKGVAEEFQSLAEHPITPQFNFTAAARSVDVAPTTFVPSKKPGSFGVGNTEPGIVPSVRASSAAPMRTYQQTAGRDTNVPKAQANK